MLTERYIEALLVDEGLADLVWEAWDTQLICEEKARTAWTLIAAMQAPRLIMGFVAIHTP